MARQTKNKRAEKVKQKRQKELNRNKTRVIRSHWDGIWYNKVDGTKARVSEVFPGKPVSFEPTLKLPIRTPNHPGV